MATVQRFYINARQLKSLVPNLQRAEEKSQLDCGGDPTKVFDYLRATVVATTMAEVRRMWDKVTELTAQGLIEVMQIDNGLRCAEMTTAAASRPSSCRRSTQPNSAARGPLPLAHRRGAPSGYRDINIHLKFGGHVCEVQIVLAAVLVIKQYQVSRERAECPLVHTHTVLDQPLNC